MITLEGSTTLRDLSTRLGWAFPREPGVETLAGFVLRELGHIPQTGETILHAGRRFKVEEMAGHRIARVMVSDEGVEAPTDANEGLATEDDGLEVPV